MSNLDVFLMGVRNLIKRKLRTFLTITGVIVGTTAIVIMISLGIGVNEAFDEQLKSWGDLTLINLYSWNAYYGNDKSAKVLDDEAIRQIQKIEHVVIATPIMDMSLKFLSGRYMTNLQVRGIYPEAMELLGYKISEGNFLDSSISMNIVYSSEAAMSFMTERERNSNNNGGRYGYSMVYSRGGMMIGGSSDPVQEEAPKPKVDLFRDKIQMSYDYNYGEKNNSSGVDPGTGVTLKKADTYTVKTAGVLAQTDDWERSYYSVMSITDIQKIFKDQSKWQKSQGYRNQTEYKGYERAYIKVDDIKNADAVVEKIKGLGFTDVYSPTESIKYMKEIAGSLQGLLAAIGGVALFIAAIGITNTMVMSIYERTKEIGVMKVIGARLRDIGKLFLLEAALIGFFGGVFGIGLSYLVAFVLNNGLINISFLKQLTWSDTASVSVIPIWLNFAALVFSTVVGLVSGFMPAMRAMRISAISAIRTE